MWVPSNIYNKCGVLSSSRDRRGLNDATHITHALHTHALAYARAAVCVRNASKIAAPYRHMYVLVRGSLYRVVVLLLRLWWLLLNTHLLGESLISATQRSKQHRGDCCCCWLWMCISHICGWWWLCIRAITHYNTIRHSEERYDMCAPRWVTPPRDDSAQLMVYRVYPSCSNKCSVDDDTTHSHHRQTQIH